MDITALLIILAIGAVAGWLAGLIMKGGGFGLIGDIIIGIVGAFVGGWLFGQLGISIGTGLVNSIFTATIGAIVLLFVIGLIKKIL
ncbi:MAG: GlsB/YeaQ/YmgE family stress response membrane protein [Sulfurovum sp.]|nr:GlsB/YeaQ/YmgE family stress response membrane protein [Sulfurovum sp.]